MSDVRSFIDELLSSDSGNVLEEYRGREIEFFKERGRKYPEKLEELFNAIFKPVEQDIIVKGGRGVGKTMVIVDAGTARFLWYDDDIFIISGSEFQAKNAFSYARQIFASEQAISEGLQDELKTCATGQRGNWMKIATSSSKQARGHHPGDPHPEMGWVQHGGVLIKDERDEMDDDIANAADGSMIAAQPGIFVTTSTMHREDGGGIAKMADEAEARGAKVITIDVFDVANGCPHDCAVCPGGQKFAGPLFGGKTRGNKTRSTKKSEQAWSEFKAATGFPLEEPGYCEGKAKEHRPGHVNIDDVVLAYRRAPNDEVFEVEYCCRARRGERNIVDAAALDRCVHDGVAYEPGYATPIATIDWGLKGWCVPLLIQAQAENTIAVIDGYYEHMANSERILAILNDWREATGMYQVYADASHPYENLKLAENGFDVVEVPFAKWKEFGAGWVRGIVERNQLRIPGRVIKPSRVGEKPGYRFANEAMRRLHSDTKGWKRDKHGKIVKKDDHGPDSLSCAAQHFAEATDWAPDDIETTGRRASFGLGG